MDIDEVQDLVKKGTIKVGDKVLYKDHNGVNVGFRGKAFEIVGFNPQGFPLITDHYGDTFDPSLNCIEKVIFSREGKVETSETPEIISKNPHGWNDEKYAQMKFFGYGKGFQGDGNDQQFP
jgi:hypothetical protein